jgi:hypothetical protein
MADLNTTHDRSGLVTGARWALAILALLFTAGAFGQFFLVGLSMFDDASRWQNHKTLGHMIGLLPYVMWIPAVLGRVGRDLVLHTLMLFILYMAQYGFINADSSIANALHPLNGSLLLVLGVMIARQSIVLARTRDTRHRVKSQGIEGTVLPGELGKERS